MSEKSRLLTYLIMFTLSMMLMIFSLHSFPVFGETVLRESISMLGKKLLQHRRLIIFALAVTIFYIVLRVKHGRNERLNSWILSYMSDEQSKRSVEILFDSLRRKSETAGKRAYILYIIKDGAYYLQICVPKELRLYTQELLSQIEPEVRHIQGGIVECPREKINSLGILSKRYGSSSIPVYHGASDIDTVTSNDKVFVGYTDTGLKVFINRRDFYRHVGVFGSTGSGKTTTCSVLAKSLANLGNRVIIMDWHGEYSGLLRGSRAQVLRPLRDRRSLNPFSMYDRGELVDILEDVFDLTQPQASLLSKLLRENRDIDSMQRLLEYVSEPQAQSGWNKEIQFAIARRMDPLYSEEGRRLFGSGNRFALPREGEILVIDLSEIDSIRLRRLYSLTFLRLIYATAAREGPLSTVVIVDEAHNVLPKKEQNFIARMLAEVRKMELGIIISTQSPSSVNIEFLKNLNTKIVHRIVTGSDKRIVIESMGCSQELGSEISSLKTGEAFLSTPELNRPVKVKVIREGQS